MDLYDVIIIGAGPAGMSAALYASRAGLKTLMIESAMPGGKLVKTDRIQNYPGLPNQNGADLAMQMLEHSTEFGTEYVTGEIIDIDIDDPKKVKCKDGKVYSGRAIIVATGTKEKKLEIVGEEENIGRGVSYCAVCDGAFYKDKEVAVIGGGNSALEEALYLTKFVKKVYLIVRKDYFKADQIVVQEVLNNDCIEVLFNTIVTEIIDDGNHVISIKIKGDIEDKEISVSGVFPYIGSIPMTKFLAKYNILDEQGYMLVDDNMETKVNALYGVGDVRKKNLRQVVTAVNDGAIAAQHIAFNLKNKINDKKIDKM